MTVALTFGAQNRFRTILAKVIGLKTPETCLSFFNHLSPAITIHTPHTVAFYGGMSADVTFDTMTATRHASGWCRVSGWWFGGCIGRGILWFVLVRRVAG